ncbi:sensor histidine kinase [Bacillus sp. Marseille-P3661]|uniref:sensor histidine kinase n=1 Tax=Bacillus sp. Marseille-P3661 TaxID=1936234 RepID=UPI000C854866|nr:sensor histidine kinase [Bacillus sp. Marseille-P3661]
MNLIIKQVIVGLIVSFGSAVLLLSSTFYAFPLLEWSELWSARVLGVPYIIVIFTVMIGIGTISGISSGSFWREKLHLIDQQLDNLIRGQKISFEQIETVQEINQIQQHLLSLEMKLKKQAELSQRLATERAVDREKSLQEVVVQERNRLARDLHDSVSQQLFAASMMMSAINETSSLRDSPVKKQLKMVENMIHQSQSEMRALLLHLRPVALKGKSLKEGIEELLTELTQKVPIIVDWKLENFEMDKGVEDQLFRILQESISNTLRHAKANSLHVMVIKRDDTVILRVVDDGVGFIVDQVKTSSYGLQNMQERALELGGTLKVISLENQGTRLEVKIPYIKNEVSGND